jgi:hypothetical protein
LKTSCPIAELSATSTGAPKFKNSTGLPSSTLRGPDVEEIVGVVRRYGADAIGVRALVDTANAALTVAAAAIGAACGSRRRRLKPLSGLADGTTTSVHASGAVRQPVFAA